MTRRFGRFLRRNTIALLALFIALSGTTFAAANVVLPANSVGAKQLKKNAVINKKIKSNAVTGAKVKNDSLTGADILESSLGKVPSAANADHATAADSATNATTAANANALGGLGPSAFVQKNEQFTRHFSCAGSAWENAFSTNAYSTVGSEKYATGGSALFRCSVNIPDGGVVTAVNFAVRDTNAGTDFGCDMWRTNMATGVGTETLMATVATSGTPGATRITDTTINQPTIDDNNYAYFVQCFIPGTDSTLGVYGANIAYTVSGAQGAGSPSHAPTTGGATHNSSTSR